MVVQIDKGLGPGAIELRELFRFAIKDHLGDTRTYQRLISAAAAYRATSVRKFLEKLIKRFLDVLSKEERKFLRMDLRSNKEPWGFLYLLFKVHKVPLKTCPGCVVLREPTAPLGTSHHRIAATPR